METTIAVSRMILSGVWDRWTKLSVLLAHSGGTLPFLAGRLESCILHDRHMMSMDHAKNRRTVWDLLKNNILLDAVVYGKAGLKAAAEVTGSDRILFGMFQQRVLDPLILWWLKIVPGTDHPFFPPLATENQEDEPEKWLSVTTNFKAIRAGFDEPSSVEGVLGGNAVRLLRL